MRGLPARAAGRLGLGVGVRRRRPAVDDLRDRPRCRPARRTPARTRGRPAVGCPPHRPPGTRPVARRPSDAVAGVRACCPPTRRERHLRLPDVPRRRHRRRRRARLAPQRHPGPCRGHISGEADQPDHAKSRRPCAPRGRAGTVARRTVVSGHAPGSASGHRDDPRPTRHHRDRSLRAPARPRLRNLTLGSRCRPRRRGARARLRRLSGLTAGQRRRVRYVDAT